MAPDGVPRLELNKAHTRACEKQRGHANRQHVYLQ